MYTATIHRSKQQPRCGAHRRVEILQLTMHTHTHTHNS